MHSAHQGLLWSLWREAKGTENQEHDKQCSLPEFWTAWLQPSSQLQYRSNPSCKQPETPSSLMRLLLIILRHGGQKRHTQVHHRSEASHYGFKLPWKVQLVFLTFQISLSINWASSYQHTLLYFGENIMEKLLMCWTVLSLWKLHCFLSSNTSMQHLKV